MAQNLWRVSMRGKEAMLSVFLTLALVLIALLTGGAIRLAAQSRTMSVQLGIVADRLAPCPPTPNCVSSDAPPADSQYVAALADPSGASWPLLLEKVGAMDGATLIASDDAYAHFTFESRLFGFVDDVEFHRRPGTGEIAVRSASRVGRGDLGANRKRVQAIRAAL
ncbi:MAG TPA: DUF1499 domain-containing protein [Gammaproteobacteria bacterium]|nr:DUF1499 domain-containing protein [Gammaproteobacteria bacterium]